MNSKDVCPCCGRTLPPLRARVAYGGLSECTHCGSDCGLPPIPLVVIDRVERTTTWLLVTLGLWVSGVAVAVWAVWSLGGSP